MDYSKRINILRNNINVSIQNNYNKNNIDRTPEQRIINNNNIIMNIKQINNNDNKQINETTLVNILNDNLFNYNDKTVKTTSWRKLNNDIKIEKLNDFFIKKNTNTIRIDTNIQEILKNMINNKKLNTKKEILYDEINKAIIDIPIIMYIEKNDKYIFTNDYIKDVTELIQEKKRPSLKKIMKNWK